MNVYKRRATNSLNFVHSDTGGGCEVRFAPYIQRHPKNSASYPGQFTLSELPEEACNRVR